MKSILDPTFQYTPSVATDLRRTFERVRRERLRIVSSVAAPRFVLLAAREIFLPRLVK
jgi:hypothetical protein